MMRKLAIAAALAAAGLGGSVNAAPVLQIVADAAGNPALVANQEGIGEAGGSSYGNGPTAGASAGVGLPTVQGGWPDTPSFAPDHLTPTIRGISGYDGSYLRLTEASNVTFQFMGVGDAGDHNQFQLFQGGVWTTLWDDKSATNGTCGASGLTANCPFAGSSLTLFLQAGLIPFKYVNLTQGTSSTNDGTNNKKDGGPNRDQPGFILGVDPYETATQFATSGQTVYAGFSDRPVGRVGDHDYQDLTVRMSAVPEPGSLLLAGMALAGLAASRRRKV